MLKRGKEGEIGIYPSAKQVEGWTIDGVHIGATGLFFKFPNEARTFRMVGLTGCTATIILVS